MVLLPNVLEARAALDLDTSRRRHAERELLPRQGLLDGLVSIIVGGSQDPDTTGRTPTPTGRTPTPTRNLSATNTNTRTNTPSTTSSPSTTARSPDVVTSPPPSRPTLTTTQTSTLPLETGNANNSISNNPSPKTGLPSVVVGVIVAASVIFGLIIIALIVRKFFQLRRRRRRGTWARGSIGPFDPPLQEKALPPPPPAPMAIDSQNRSYPAYPPNAVTFANNGAPYSPAAPSSAGYAAPYPFGGNNASVGTGTTTTAGMFNTTAYTPNDLAGPIVITPPTPSITASAGTISIVKRTFMPSLPDELSIATGDQVRVLSVYDDGWALCEKVVGGEKGVVPQECLESVESSNTNAPKKQTADNEETRLKRNSSLRRGQDQTY